MIKVGTCGWSVRGGRKKYFETFGLVELQNTFYKLPMIKTLIKLKEDAPDNFEFTIKAWQVITHPPSSPTWRRAGLKVNRDNACKYGFLKPTEENFKAWEEILVRCKALNAHICIIQTPPSFKASSKNVNNMEKFFTTIRRNGVTLGWEPRGDWNVAPELVKSVCKKLELVHIVDPFKRDSQWFTEICYFRLHGIGPKEVNYRYKYLDSDLNRLMEICKRYLSFCDTVYVLFNNIYMSDDAVRFKYLLSSNNIPVA